MDCERCNEQKATVTLTEIEVDGMRTVNLCAACAQQKGIAAGSGSPPTGEVLAQLAQSVGGHLGAPEQSCEYCGLGPAEFRRAGRLGCPQCYVSFKGGLRKILRRIHGDSQHVGKTYVSAAVDADPALLRLSTLRRRLERAVELEDFEAAAELRDEINELTEAS